jgi:hypothetical protein
VAIVDRHEALLDRLDVALGDGDHGTNMVIGLRSVARSLDDLPPSERPTDVGALLRLIGHGLVGSVGGASGRHCDDGEQEREGQHRWHGCGHAGSRDATDYRHEDLNVERADPRIIAHGTLRPDAPRTVRTARTARSNLLE